MSNFILISTNEHATWIEVGLHEKLMLKLVIEEN
jgi:hypothetical protein